MEIEKRRRARRAAVTVILLATAAGVALMWRDSGDAGMLERTAVVAKEAVSGTKGQDKAVKPEAGGEGRRKKPVSLNVRAKELLEMSTVPEFTKEQVEAYLLRTGRSERSLALAAILSPEGGYLEEARGLNPESRLCDAVDAAKLADEARMGDEEKLALLREKCGTGENAAVYKAQLAQLLCEKLKREGVGDAAVPGEISELASGAMGEAEAYYVERSLKTELADLMTTEGGLSGQRQLLALEYWRPHAESSNPVDALVAAARALEERAGGAEARDADAAKAAEGLALSAMAWIQESRDKADNVSMKLALLEQERALLELGTARRALGPHVKDMEAYTADLRRERGEMQRLSDVTKSLAFKGTEAQWEHFSKESERLGYLEALKATENDEVYSDFFE